MDLHLEGRVALVAGGSKGIGRSMALALAGEGVDVAIGARGAENLENTAREIRETMGRRCLPVQADLTRLDDCQRFVQTTVEHFGRADILVCSANEPGGGKGTFATVSDEEWVHHMNVKFLSAVRCSREVVPYMRKNGWGRIVLISGMGGREVKPDHIDNGPACAAMANFGKQLSAQVVGDGIRVNTIDPGLTWTPRRVVQTARYAANRGISAEELAREEASRVPLGRFIQPEEIAYLALFLCSDLADAITGQSIAVDGGLVKGIFY